MQNSKKQNKNKIHEKRTLKCIVIKNKKIPVLTGINKTDPLQTIKIKGRELI